MMKHFILGLLGLTLLVACQEKIENKLQQGDLLFKDNQTGSISSAIKEVTPSSKNYSFSHVGILFFEKNQWFVLEAVPKFGVRITTLKEFRTTVKNSTTKIVLGRLKKEYQFDLAKLIDYGKLQVGKKYDFAFTWNNEQFYCSELVYQMFANAEQKEAFSPKPMTFKKKGTTDFHPTWIQYYKELGIEIPEGKTGINPNAMANAQSIELLFELPLLN